MSDRLVYLDTSAFAKLVNPEAETMALREFLQHRSLRVSSALLRTEMLRTAARHSQQRVAEARRQLRNVYLIDIDRVLLDQAGTLPPPEMRSLDSIHIAAALSLGDDLAELVTYDNRMVAAAESHGLLVRSPA